MNGLNIKPVGFISTPYTQKFGIPRQACLSSEVEGIVEFHNEFNNSDYLRGIEQFSHLWLVFVFDQHTAASPSALVRPPRLGGNEKIGVFASRSSFRPNPLGMSLVKYRGHCVSEGQLRLTVAGVDMLDKTPIIDIKPYIPYADGVDDAAAGYAQQAPKPALSVAFSSAAKQQLALLKGQYPELQRVIQVSLEQDPRPAYKRAASDTKQYAMRLYQLDITWRVKHNIAEVIQILPESD